MLRRVLILLCVGFVICAASARGRATGGAKPNRDRPATRNRLVDKVNKGQPVPSPLTFSSNFERIVIVRMTYKTDMLEGLKQAVRKEKIRNAVILSGIGSLTSYHVHVVGNTTFPTKNLFMKDDEGAYDLTAVNGYVVGGRVHAHVTFSGETKAMAGHLEPGTRAFTFIIVTLGVFGDEVDLTRLDDKSWR